MNYRDLAIIGMSGIFPGADELGRFYRNLAGGIDSVRELPEERLKSSGYDPSPTYGACGYLDRVDQFDHRFFKVSLREAYKSNPQQRLLLQLVCQALENAGYSLTQFRESKTSLYLAATPANRYNDLFKNQDTELTLNNTIGMIAGKIAYYLDFRGPALMVDSVCSSSLLAVHEACKSIHLGEANAAIAGGIHILHSLPPGDLKDVPMAAKDGKCKAFSADADGTGVGEGGGVVVIKPLSKALEDRDHIYAVIKGGAVNQDGGRGIGSAAPSPEGQTDVIVEAWKNARIDPTTISYIEAHGTGTKLGDPIEIQALTDAFKQFTDKKKFCAIGSVKTNLGHLNTAAGIAGLIKVILSLKHQKLFPSLHFNTPNPLIDFENTAVFVNDQLTDWQVEDKPGPGVRRAGLSVFSMTGTNIHMVLEEAPKGDQRQVEKKEKEWLFTFSAKSSQALKNYLEAAIHYLPGAEGSPGDISYTLNQGRDDYPYRYATCAKNKQQLEDHLKSTLSAYDPTSEDQRLTMERSLLFIFSGDISFDPEVFDRLSGMYDVFKQTAEKCSRMLKGKTPNNYTNIFVYQYALYCLAESLGLTAANVIGTGVSNLVVSVITGRAGLAEAMERAAAFTDAKPFDHQKFRNVINAMLKNEDPIFVEIASQGILGNEIKKFIKSEDLLMFPTPLSSSPLETISLLYQKGVNIKWERFYENQELYRVEASVYPFEKTACWVPRAKRKKTDYMTSQPEDEDEEDEMETGCILIDSKMATDTEIRLARIWGEVLGVEELERNSNYFDLGGDSIIEVQLINRIQEEFGVEVDFERIFEKETLKEQAAFINFIQPSSVIPITPIDRTNDLPLSSAQESQYFLYRMNPENPHYNMFYPIRLKGTFNLEAMEQTINELLKRHEIFRTVYYLKEGKPVQKINRYQEVNLPGIDISSEPDNDKERKIREFIEAESVKPFDLSKDLLIRFVLIDVGANDHVLLINVHHIAADGWSLLIMIREINTMYNAFSKNTKPNLPDISIQYADYASWQKNRLKDEKNYDKLLSFWKKRLEGPLHSLELPYDRPRSGIENFEGANYRFSYSKELSEKIRELSKQEQATVFHTLLAAYKTLLFRYTQVEDIMIGIPIAGRGKRELENVIGLFANMLVMRTKLSGTVTFRDLLKQVRNASISAFAHQEMPFDKLAAEFEPERKASQNPFFQLVFGYQNIPGGSSQPSLKFHNLETLELETHKKTIRFELEFALLDTPKGIQARLMYARELFSHERIVRMAKHYQVLLESIVSNPDQTLVELPIMSEEEKKQLLQKKHKENLEAGVL